MTVTEFASKIRAKHPTAYMGMDDTTLVNKVLAKHPEYRSQVSDAFDPSQDDLAKRYGTDGMQGDKNYLADPKANIATEPEQQLVNNANAAAAGAGIPSMVEGLGGLALRGVGAIGEGLAPTAEKAANWLGSRVLGFARSTLPNDAMKASDVIDSATDYAMKPHPEIQQAIMDLKGATPTVSDAEVGTSMVPASESTVKMPQESLPSGTKELPPGNEALEAGKEVGPATGDTGPVLEGEVTNPPESPAEEPEINNLDHLNEPIISATGSTKDMLAATDKQLDTVGGAIGDTLTKLNETGKQFDPAPVVQKLNSMYIKDAAGKIIPAGTESEQAVNNAAVSHALETLKAEAQDADGNLISKLPWERANAIKGSLQKLADTSPIYEHAGAMVKEAIDDQAQKALAESGGDVQSFQALRGAYSNLKNIRRTLNNNALGQMGAKNALPVVRSMAAMGGVATGNPGMAAAAGADFVGRRYASQMLASGLRDSGETAQGVSEAGRAMTAGKGIPAATSVANGLLATEDDQ